MKNMCLVATLFGLVPGLGLAQTTEDLVNHGKKTENVTTQSMGYDRKNYSLLTNQSVQRGLARRFAGSKVPAGGSVWTLP